MGLSLWIAPESQFGVLDFKDARPGARRRALVAGIKRLLFEVPGEDDFAGVLRAFSESADKVRFPQPTAVRLWQELTSTTLDDAIPLRDSAGKEVEPAREPSFDAVFCIALHGLCQAFAVQRLRADSEVADDDFGDGEEGDDHDVDNEPEFDRPDTRLWANEAFARRVIAALLVQSASQSRRESEKSDLRVCSRVIAAALLDLLVAVRGAWLERRQDGEGKPWRIVARAPALERRLESFLALLPYHYTPQPLKYPVAYKTDDGGPADGDQRDYFRVNLIDYGFTNDFLRRLHDQVVRSDCIAPEFQRYIDAVNVQQAVAWRINLPLLVQAQGLVGFAGDPAARDAIVRKEGLDVGAVQDLAAWIERAFYTPIKTRDRKKYRRPGEVLDHPLMRSGLAELTSVGTDSAQASFFLPWKADYRGRIYAETPWLTPQGGDLQRALLEFADGRCLDASGVAALRRHGANLAQRKRILDDLAITGRHVVTLEERERWVLKHERDILASAASPIAVPFWRKAADKPMQFLAFCLAYRQWALNPDSPVHLPVQIDGTCNGLQHIAMLTGDSDLARAVNVLPRGDGLPGDIYSEIAAVASETLGSIKSLLHQKTKHREGLQMADAWMAIRPGDWLNRATAKKVIMTVPYGAREGSQAEYVAEAIAGSVEETLRNNPTMPQVDALCDWVAADEERGKSLYRLTKGQFKALRKVAYDHCVAAKKIKQELRRLKAENHMSTERVVELKTNKEQHLLEAEKAKQELLRLEIVTAYSARVIVKHLRHALANTFPCVDQFSDWLRQKANACAGLPLLWPTPLGFPVCQPKFELVGSGPTAQLGGSQSIRVYLEHLGNTVDPNKQSNALLPNLIHSLDATHLAMTLNEVRKCGVRGIGSIHDCLLCHPNDADAVSQAVRKTFARLYRSRSDGVPAVLADWSDWMDGIARLMPLESPSTVLGELDHPGGAAGKIYAAQALSDGKAGDAAKRALSLIEDLRRLPPSRQCLMRSLLEFMHQESMDEKTSRRDAASREGGKKKAGRAEGLSIVAGIPLGDGSAISEYFFS